MPFHQSVGAVRSVAFQPANHTAGIRPAGLIEQQVSVFLAVPKAGLVLQ